jgi:hypothetical protein
MSLRRNSSRYGSLQPELLEKASDGNWRHNCERRLTPLARNAITKIAREPLVDRVLAHPKILGHFPDRLSATQNHLYRYRQKLCMRPDASLLK